MTLALLLAAATGAWAQQDDAVPVSGQANQWQYTMPDVNVELTVRYFPTATFSEGGEPTAIEGVVAGTDNPIVTAASQQGTVMYYATTNAEATAPDYDVAGWTAVPTAAIVQGDRTESTEVYVYYYIKGNDAPEGLPATAENTFTDTDILGPLTVTLMKNVFSVALRPATQFTTDGGQATVTVDGQPTDNFMLKQGQTITIAAAEGYTIRSAKMGGAAIPAGEVTSSDLGKLLGEDGYLYANKAAAEAAGTTAVAKIVYVGSNASVVKDKKGNVYDRGLALHLMDDYFAEEDIPSAMFCEPSKAQWEMMFEAAGGYRALSDGLRESGGDDLYSGTGHYYSSDFPLYFDFNTGEWKEIEGFEDYETLRYRYIHAIAPATALSGDDATLNDAHTVATYMVPDHDVTVKYLLARDLTQQVAFDGIPAEPVDLTMGPDGNYQPATPLDIQLNDAIAGANIISADGLTVSYEKQDGDTWTAADDFLTNMQPGTYRIVAAATDEMSPYDGTLTSATFTLTDNGNGETTGIREMEDGKWKMKNGSYDLQGRRVESSIFNSQSSILKKGVYIVNGKKKVVK